MPVPSGRSIPSTSVRRLLERLDGLPLRPTTARLVLSASGEAEFVPTPEVLTSSRLRSVTEVDPGWVLAQTRRGESFGPLALIEGSAWWTGPTAPVLDVLHRLWRHAVAVSQAAHRLARERGDGESSATRIARAGLLHGLGLWAIAAVQPDWLVEWSSLADPRSRRALELRDLGTEANAIGRRLAERWGCDPLVADAAWLHADVDGRLNAGASEASGLVLIQEAFALAERTPWALGSGTEPRPAALDPRLRLLIAEVQVRCGTAFVDNDATIHEERMARSNARLRRELAGLQAERAATDSLLQSLAGSLPTESPRRWAERAALCLCGVPGVATARVVWTGPGAEPAPAEEPPRAERPATRVLELVDRGRPCAEIHLWEGPDGDGAALSALATRPAWNAWAALLAERTRLEERLEALVRGHRDWVEQEAPSLQRAKLDALAEFAAGAGHELNNPLAVIVGRAQLLLARTTDPDATRSLRAILTQAQRTHRILRDLMFIARTPEPRPRFCQPDEVVKACLRDMKTEADARGVRLVQRGSEPGPRVWADPDALRHLADALMRNALESTPEGGTVQFVVGGGLQEVRWTVSDNGRGITPAEGEHLFDPFYCGRQAGRGLGLGLPRAARIVQQAGGELRWHSAPGQGTVFQVHIPLAMPPRPPSAGGEGGSPTPRNEAPLLKA